MSSYGEAPKGEALKAQFKAKKFGKYEFELYPELWEITEIDEYYDGKEWNKTKFIERPDPSPPSESGIYMFVVAPHCGKLLDHSYIFYVGQAVNLNVRYSQYLKEKDCLCDNPREKVVNFLNHLQDFVFFYWTLVPASELDKAENLLKDNLTPPANTQKTLTGRLEEQN